MHLDVILKRIIKGSLVYAFNHNNRRETNTWVFGEWFGDRCGDNVTHLANYIARNNQDINLYWICKGKCRTDRLDKRIKILLFDEEKTLDIMKKAYVVVMGQGYGDFSTDGYNYFGNSISVNLWHGILWKTIGYDTYPSNNILSKLYVRITSATQSISAFLSVSDKYTSVFSKAFKLKNATPILAGYPRNEDFYNDEFINLQREQIIRRIGACQSGTPRIIVYMPTYRSNSDNFSFAEMLDSNEFSSFIEEHDIYIIQKTHFASQRINRHIQTSSNSRIINIEDIDPQELLAAADVLITDYSGCFYDYLLLDRPIIHFVYDYDFYANEERGLYFSLQEVSGGEIVKSKDGIMFAIQNALYHPEEWAWRRKEIRETYLQYEMRYSSEKIYLEILKMINEKKR